MKKNNSIIFVLSFLVIFFLSPQTSRAQENLLKFSPKSQEAINNLAKDILTSGLNPNITDVKSQLDPNDYATVKRIKVLPSNPLFFFKYIFRESSVFFTFDIKQKSHLMLLNGNEKTLEALLALENSTKTKNSFLKNMYINIASMLLDSTGADFDYISKNIDKVDKQEAGKFAEIYLKHQILLQEEEDTLSEVNFLKIEAIRIKHLGSLSHIIVSSGESDKEIAQELASTIDSQVGLNYKNLAAAAILRDLENSATQADRVHLLAAQKFLVKKFESDIAKLTKAQRLAEIERYAKFIHGNPIRQFQAYNQISKSFKSAEIKKLAEILKDKAAENFKEHLDNLDSSKLQKQFSEVVFSEYPVDLRLLFYTQIQLKGDEKRTENLTQIRNILGSRICENFGQKPDKLAQTRFYSDSIKNPDVLDIKIAKFLSESFNNCSAKSDESVKLAADLQKAIIANFTKEAKIVPVVGKLPTKSQAEEILKEEGIVNVPEKDEQKVAELIEEELKDIEDIVLTTPETVVEEVVAIEEPIQEEIIEKEEQIVEEIIDAAESGETSPFVEELPEEVQEEVIEEAEKIANSTPVPTVVPTVVPTTVPTIVPTVTPLPTLAPTPVPTVEPLPTEEPTLIETVTETVEESSTPEPVPTVAPAPEEPEVTTPGV